MLAPHLHMVWEGFLELQGDRPVSAAGAPRPIPFAALDTWARRRWPDDDFDWLFERMQALDRAHLRFLAASVPPPSGAPPS